METGQIREIVFEKEKADEIRLDETRHRVSIVFPEKISAFPGNDGSYVIYVERHLNESWAHSITQNTQVWGQQSETSSYVLNRVPEKIKLQVGWLPAS